MADWHLYCDESSKDAKFTVFGGVLLPAEECRDLEFRIELWRYSSNMIGEVAWKKTTRLSVERHKQFARGTIKNADFGNLAFRCAVFNREDRNLFLGTKPNDRCLKQMIQFLTHLFALEIPEGDRLYIYPDHQFLPCRPEDMVRYLNDEIETRGHGRPVAQFEPLNSEDSHFVQMADLLSGTVAAANNRDFDPCSKRGMPKAELIEYVSKIAGGIDFTKSTYGRLDFKVWHFVPYKRKSAPSPIAFAMNRDKATDFGTR